MIEKLKFESAGQGIPLVFIHGWGLNAGVWQPVMQVLADRYQVIAIDLPGFGNNVQVSSEPYNLTTISNQIVDTIEVPAIYVGWSLGGLIASHIAIHHAQQVLGLVTIASSPCFVEQAQWPGMKSAVLKNFYRLLIENSQQTINNFLKLQAMGSPHIRDNIRQLQQLIANYPQPSTTVLAKSLAVLEHADIRTQLADINSPVLRMYGQLDSLVPKAVTGLVQTLMPKSEQYIFSQAAHAPFISHFNEFIDVLLSWCERIDKVRK